MFLRRDAIAYGYQDRDLQRALKDGQLVRVRHGAYADALGWSDLDPVGRHRLRAQAVLLTHGPGVALSHVTGAALHGMRIWGMDLDRVHVTRTSSTASRRHHDIAYHDAPPSFATSFADGAPVLSPAHCAIGAASHASVEAGVVLIDSAYHLGLCTAEALRLASEEMAGWTGTGRLRVTLPLAQPGSESVGESRARFLFWKLHLPRPELQFPVYDGARLVGIADFAWPALGVLGEFDGKVKYGRLAPSDESSSDVVYREKVREDRMRELTGWRFIRLSWYDLEHPQQTSERLRSVLR